jgi:hypothetical protein
MTTLKIWDGTAWQTTSGQGANGQGVPAGGATSSVLIKNSAGDYDTKWGTLPGQELAYAQSTASLTVTATTAPTAQTAVSAGAVTFDGSPVMVEFYSPGVYPPTIANSQIVLNLWDGSTDLGYVAQSTYPGGTNQHIVPVTILRRLTPSAGSHTYSIRAWASGAGGAVMAGFGGIDTYAPVYIRITRV